MPYDKHDICNNDGENLQVWLESQCYKMEEHLVCLCLSEQQFDVKNNEIRKWQE